MEGIVCRDVVGLRESATKTNPAPPVKVADNPAIRLFPSVFPIVREEVCVVLSGVETLSVSENARQIRIVARNTTVLSSVIRKTAPVCQEESPNSANNASRMGIVKADSVQSSEMVVIAHNLAQPVVRLVFSALNPGISNDVKKAACRTAIVATVTNVFLDAARSLPTPQIVRSALPAAVIATVSAEPACVTMVCLPGVTALSTATKPVVPKEVCVSN